MLQVCAVSFSLGPFCAISRFEPESLVLEDLFVTCALHAPGFSFLDVVDSSLWSELSSDAQEFEAESWSLVVDPSFCSRQEKDVIKRQDVIFGEHFKYAQAWFFITLQRSDLRQTTQLIWTLVSL